MPNHYTEEDVELARRIVETDVPMEHPELEPLVEPAPRRRSWEDQGFHGPVLDLLNRVTGQGTPAPAPAPAPAPTQEESDARRYWEERGYSGMALDMLVKAVGQGPEPEPEPAPEPVVEPEPARPLTFEEQGYRGAALDFLNTAVGQDGKRDFGGAVSELLNTATGAEALAVAETADQGVSLPGLTDEEQATAIQEADVAGEPLPVPAAAPAPVTIPQAGALYRLGVNAGKQATARKGIHDAEKTRLEAELDARKVAEGKKKTRMAEWSGKLARLEDELRHFGMDKDDMNAAQALLKRQPGPEWTLDQRENLTRQQAMAKARLQSARTINTMGPFRHMASKFLAALSVGAGSWAAVRTGRNPAMELYKSAIERDIAAQKGAYASKAGRLTRHINTYDRIQSEIGDELTSTLLLAALQYGAGEQQALGEIELLKGEAEKFRYQKTAADLRANKAKLIAEAQKAYLQKQLTVGRARDIGVLGVTYMGRELPDGSRDTGMTPDKQEVKKIREAGAAYKQFMQRIAGLMRFSGKVDFFFDHKKKAAAGAAWEDIIALAAQMNKMGVLQKAERENLEKVFPRPGGLKDNLGHLRPALVELQRRANDDWIGFMATKPHYKLDPAVGKKEWGIKAEGQED